MTSEDVIGCDWYPDFSEDNFRMHVCESQAFDAYWCGEKTGGKLLSVKNSICPPIGQGLSAYWMTLPKKDDDRWVKFDIEKPPNWNETYHEVLIRLFNGSHYTGFIEVFDWCPTFNMWKHGSLESVDCYMELPESPKFIAPPELSEEEKKEREIIHNEWLKKFEDKDV